MNEPQTVWLRRVQQSDELALHRLIHYTIDACYSGVYPPRAVQHFRDFHSESKIAERSRSGFMVVAELAGELIGTGALVSGEITGVFVHPDFQGQGHGRTIMQELERQALEAGHGKAVLSVSLPSRAFYEGLGYEIVEERSIDVGAGQCLDFWKAEKKLKSS